ncbi:MAG: hypothetical protein WBH03_18025, partial [Cyclobacteriaceae bacterium]
MSEGNFEDLWQDRFDGFEDEPASGAWEQIDKRLSPRRPSYRPVLLLLLALLIVGGGYLAYTYTGQDTEVTGQHTNEESVVNHSSLQKEKTESPLADDTVTPDVTKTSGESPMDNDHQAPDKNEADHYIHAEADIEEEAQDQSPVSESSPVRSVVKNARRQTSVTRQPHTRSQSEHSFRSSRDTEAPATQGQSAASEMIARDDGLEQLDAAAARLLPHPDFMPVDIYGIPAEKEATEKAVIPARPGRPSYLSLYVTPQWGYHRYLPGMSDDLLITSVTSEDGLDRTAWQAYFSYEQQLSPAWSWEAGAGWMMQHHQFTYQHQSAYATSTEISVKDDVLVVTPVFDRQTATVSQTSHSAMGYAGMHYTIDRDKAREHAVGVGLSYLYPLNSMQDFSDSPQLLGELGYRWIVRWQTGSLQTKDWRMQVGPVFRYELTPGRQVATG